MVLVELLLIRRECHDLSVFDRLLYKSLLELVFLFDDLTLIQFIRDFSLILMPRVLELILFDRYLVLQFFEFLLGYG